MSVYDSRIAAKMKDIEEIQKERAEALSYSHLLKVGQYLKRKFDHNYHNERHYTRILHVSDSGYGYPLVIAEWFTIEDMRIFHHDEKDIIVPNQHVYMTVSQWYQTGSDLKYYEPITEEEYQRAKVEALSLLATPNVPQTREIQTEVKT